MDGMGWEMGTSASVVMPLGQVYYVVCIDEVPVRRAV